MRIIRVTKKYMKEVFTPEVANSLGYQKYWPEKSDWALAIGGTVFFFALVFCITLFTLDKTGYTKREEQKIETRKSAISEWCKNAKVKNLAETKECLNY